MKKLSLLSIVVIMVVCLFAVFPLSGCKTEQAAETTAAAAETTAAATTAAGETTAAAETPEEVEVLPAMDINVWDWQPGENYLTAMKANFEAFKVKYPQYANVNFIHNSVGADYWTLLTPAVAAGEGVPEIFGILQSQTELFDAMLDLRPIMSADEEWMAQYKWIDTPDLGTSGLDDRVTGIAIDRWVAGILYYKDMLEQYNLELPVYAEDFIAMAPVLEKDGIEVMAMGGDSWVLEIMFAYMVQQLEGKPTNPAGVAKDWFTGDLKYDSESSRIALQAIKDMWDGGVWREDELQLFQFAEAIQNFQAKKAWGYWCGGTWWSGAQNPEDLEAGNIGVIPMAVPAGGDPGVAQASTGQPYGVYINIAPEKKQVALDFIKFLSSPEAVKIYLENQILPAGEIPEGMSSPNSLINEMIAMGDAASAAGLIYDPHQWDGALLEPVADGITSVCLGMMTIDEALAGMRTAQDEVVARIKEQRGQ